MQDFVFKDKKALIIGGTGSIGLSLAVQLNELGSSVTVTGRNPPREKSEELEFIQLDFEKDGIECLEEDTMRHALNETDILAVTYGPFIQKPLHQTSSDDWKKVSLHDFALPGIALSLALPSMMERNFGRILFFGGTRTDQIRSYKTNAAYAAAKTALDVIVKSTAANYAEYGITCNAICPGFTRNAPSPEYLMPESEITNQAVRLLLSPESNGQIIRVDKGWEPN
ncbi:MAG: SDR family NAD(P)-dependent oxidoreductase [Treponema sp.]|nr:SDR family NAD(P)-dependent oxidoreductase [Treponema sp.]